MTTTRSWMWVAATAGVVLGLQAAPLASHINPFCSDPGGGNQSTTICTSTSSQETHTRVDLAELQAYETRVLGYWFTNTPSFADGYVYDMTFLVAPGDPAVTQAFADAAAALSLFLQPQPFSIGAPQLIASNSVLGPSIFLGPQFTGSTQTLTEEISIGPGTIIVGDRDQGGVPFDVLAGTTNINENTHTENFFDDLFQATRTNFATYQITAEVTAPPVPEPATFALVGGALAAGVARRWLRTRRGGAGR